jgi:hypothetical protein
MIHTHQYRLSVLGMLRFHHPEHHQHITYHVLILHWLLTKISKLTNKPIKHCELTQVGRYLPGQQYLQHCNTFDLSTPHGIRFASNGGQRTVTVLIYLNTVPPPGGATNFPSILQNQSRNSTATPPLLTIVQAQPVQCVALVFFLATVDGYLDQAELHAAVTAPLHCTKYVSQIMIRQSTYTGTPSKPLEISLPMLVTTTTRFYNRLHLLG